MIVSSAPLHSLGKFFQGSSRARSGRAVYVHLFIAMLLGYYISPTKSSLFPTQSMIHLGFGIDSSTCSYSITEKYRAKFRKFRLELLERKTANLNDLQKWVGKCNHLRLAFPGNSLFTIEVRRLMPGLGEDRLPLPQAALDEIAFWSFVDSTTEPVPWLLQQHVSLELCTDASGYGWGATVVLPDGPVVLQDYWSSELFHHDICCKEALAVLFALQSLEQSIFRRRVDVRVDNEGLVHAWSGLKSRSPELVGVLQALFLLTVDLRFSLNLTWISTKDNPADAPSRSLQRSDSMLSVALRRQIWDCYGPLSFDLMALPSNVFRDPAGRALKFFSRAPVPNSAGVNVFSQRPPKGRLYVYPPFAVITPLIRLLAEWGGVNVVMVLPSAAGSRPVWHSLLLPFILDALPLFSPGSRGVLRIPSSSGFIENRLPLSFGLTAYNCQFPLAPAPRLPPSLPPVKILLIGDSVLRPLLRLTWPAPFRLLVRSFSGASFARCVEEALKLSFTGCQIVIVHGGVNDASRGSADFSKEFPSSASVACSRLASAFSSRAILLSSAWQSRNDEINVRIGQANQFFRDTASAKRWGLISNDNVRIFDLIDEVHLNASGTAKLHRNILMSLKSL